MAIHWQIPFKSLRTRTVYTVNIYDASFSGTPVVLKGGAEPFTTDEDDDPDEFIPIRKQTGNISIVDNGKDAAGNNFDYQNLLPTTDTDRPVTLTHTEGNTTVIDWQGFIQAQTFGATLYEMPQERQLPVHCALSILDNTEINYTQKELKNFAYLLNQIIDAIPTLTISTIYVQGMSASDFLLKQIDWQNFVNETTDGTLEARYNLYQCLEDMCRFFGWTIRTYRDDLYLTCADDTTHYERSNWLQLSKANLVTMAGGSTAGTTISNFPTVNIQSEAIYASFDNGEFLNRGPNKVTVTININKAEDNIVDIQTDQYSLACTSQGWGSKTTETDGSTRYTNDLLALSLPFLSGTATSGKASFNIGRLFQADSYSDYEDVPMIRMKAAYNGSVYASLQTIYEHCFSGNTLMFHAEAYLKYEKLPTKESMILTVFVSRIRIGIGKTRASAKWLVFNGSAQLEWSSTPGDLLLYYDKNGNTFIMDSNQTVAQYMARIDNGLTGLLFIDFLGADTAKDIGNFYISMFHSAQSDTADPDNFDPGWSTVGEQEFVAKNGTNVSDETNIDNIYGCDGRLAFGYGILINPNGRFFKDWYDTGSGAMEQHLADRIVSYWSTSKMSRTIDALPGIQLVVGALGSGNYLASDKISPLYQVAMSSKNFHAISISHQWRDDVTRYTLLEIPF